MLKRLIFCLWILLPFFLFAQNEEAHFTVHDSLPPESIRELLLKQ